MTNDSSKSSSRQPLRRHGLGQSKPKLTVHLPEIVQQALELRASNEQTSTSRLLVEIVTEQLDKEIREIQQEDKED